MRVLHINNAAGVPSLFVQALRERGIDADLIVPKRHPFGFPSETVLNLPAPRFFFRVLKLSRNYDIVHMHGLSRLLFNFNIFGLKAMRSTLVLHLHGTEIRASHGRLSTKIALEISDQILVGTPDLLSYCPSAIWLPTPIDPVFKPSANPERRGKALYFRKWYEPEKERMVYNESVKMGLRLTVPDRPIPYKKMPFFLNQFEVFFDRFTIPSLSKTALEALACGCKVVSWNGVITNPKELLTRHSLQSVSGRLVKLYEQFCTKVECV